MTRTDVHRPAELVTEDYEFVFAYDSMQPAWAIHIARTDWWRNIQRTMVNVHEGGQCDHCGARLRYVAILKHTPTGQHLEVGETCLDNRFSLATAEFQRLRKAAELDRKQQRIKTAATELLEQLSDEGQSIAVELLMKENVTDDSKVQACRAHHIVSDIRHKLWLYGSISERQIACVVRCFDENWMKWKSPADMAAEQERDRLWEERKIDAPTGRQTIVGDVVFTRQQETMYGLVTKALVVCEGFKVWMSLPSAVHRDDVYRKSIAVAITLKKSDRDNSFAFGSRPAKLKVMGDMISNVENIDIDESELL